MDKKDKKGVKASQVITLLESLSIQKYTLYSDIVHGAPRIIEIEDVRDYYKLVKNLALKSNKEYIGSPCFMDKLETSYEGWVFKTSIQRTANSELLAIVDNFEKEKLLV